MIDPSVRPGTPEDVPRMVALLRDSSLSPEDVASFPERFRIALLDGELVGMVGIEPYGSEALLRSLAVAAPHRSQGIGNLLLADAIRDARRQGLRRLVLLTTTAAGYFANHGFRPVDRARIVGGVAASSQFRGACPATATCMEMLL